ncbi:hypothetical protein O3M35_000438 [Rhynocoris fuscipes]|uniref:DNA-3-methyladenine glycosylase n=1 Tax=Rhynocoris fuscipes TaxID=488301 RepID=A0AAW1DRU5_9HEMI
MFKYNNCQFSLLKVFVRNLSKNTKNLSKKIKQTPILIDKNNGMNRKFGADFYGLPCIELAKKLLGQILVRCIDSERRLRCRIVETEAYLGPEDKASHSYQVSTVGKKIGSTYLKPGSACVTSVYGVHLVLSISSLEEGACVLLRAAEPICGAEEMRRQRAIFLQKNSKNPLIVNKSIRIHRLCSGPGRLAAALGVSAKLDGEDLTKSNKLWIEKGPEEIAESQIVECPRIGLSIGSGDWIYKPLRCYILGHTSVSQRDKTYEKELQIASGVLSEDGKLYLK